MSTRAILDVSKIAALSRVCEAFTKACADHQVDPVETYLAIGRLLGISAPLQGVSPAPVQTPVRNTELTSAQKAEAKRLAREAKAKRLHLSPSEINLTPEEVKKALGDYHKSLSGGSGTTGPANQPSGETSSSSPKAAKSAAKEKGKAPAEPVALTNADRTVDPNARFLAKSRLDSTRRNILKVLPWIVDSATNLHLVGYVNYRIRLVRKWNEFSSEFGALAHSPTRGLPDVSAVPKAKEYLAQMAAGIQRDSSDPDIYHLADPAGESYWERDKPSKACPSILSDALDQDVIDALAAAALGNTPLQ